MTTIRTLRLTFALAIAVFGAGLFAPAPALAIKVFINPSNQTANPVTGGGNEAQYALINANIMAGILRAAGFEVRVDQDFTNAPANANSWGADIFVSVHSNAGGGHGTETLYKTTGGQTLAGHIQNGLLDQLPYESRGLKQRNDLHVLNNTNMYAVLPEVVFHDCGTTSGRQGHPPSESSFLKSADGQQRIGAGLAAGVCSYFGQSCDGGTTTPTGRYRGVVYRAPDTTDRIVGARVTLSNGAVTTSSDTGYFEFVVPAGPYTATATAAGFRAGSTSRDVPANGEVWGSIGLEPDTVQPDRDGDGVPDATDNCPDDPNGNQADSDGDGIGDACDEPPPPMDTDEDGVPDVDDNCPFDHNAGQADADGDGIGDACDPTPLPDRDGDGAADIADNCPDTPNPAQLDSDGDGLGDACDATPLPDRDGDGIPDGGDNCPDKSNPGQEDSDGDGLGDVCDTTPLPDRDGDGVPDGTDNCPDTPNRTQRDGDGDGIGDACDEPVPPVDVVQPRPDVAQPGDTGQPRPDIQATPDTGTPGFDVFVPDIRTSSPDAPVGRADAGVADGGTDGDGSGGSSCATTGTGAHPSALLLLLAVLALVPLALRRRARG